MLAEFSIYLNITDPAALIAAARAKAFERNRFDEADAVPDDDVTLALRILLDPPDGVPGCEIIDSNVEAASTEDVERHTADLSEEV